MNRSSLDGLLVGVTRSVDGAGALADRLAARGAVPVVVPVVDVVHDAAGVDELTRAVADAESGTWLVVTSPNGAAAVVTALHGPYVDMPLRRESVRLAAVGPTTEAELTNAGFDVVLRPERFDAEALATSLVESPAPHAAILAISASAGTTLDDVLSARGWSVSRVETYRTIGLVPTAPETVALRTCDVLTVTSGSAARAIAELGGSWPPAVCLGRATAAATRSAGLRVVGTAASSTLDGLVDAVAVWADSDR